METERIANATVAFVGGGNMAEALIKGIVVGGVLSPAQVRVSDPDAERRELLEERYGVETFKDNREAVQGSDVCVLAVKPQIMADVTDGLSGALERETLVVSIAAGITTQVLAAGLAAGQRVVRAMPNTPALVGMGISAICKGEHADEKDMEFAELLLGSLGRIVRVDEKQMDAVTAVSGSGPAYLFLLMESMIAAGLEMGLSAENARELTCATAEGAARLMVESGEDASVLRERVTSKGGTTAAALNHMFANGFSEIVRDAMKAARDRSAELSSQ